MTPQRPEGGDGERSVVEDDDPHAAATQLRIAIAADKTYRRCRAIGRALDAGRQRAMADRQTAVQSCVFAP
jgi:hypothetical protein